MDLYRSAQCFLSRNPSGILPIRPGRPHQRENKILSNSSVLWTKINILEKLSQLHLLIIAVYTKEILNALKLYLNLPITLRSGYYDLSFRGEKWGSETLNEVAQGYTTTVLCTTSMTPPNHQLEFNVRPGSDPNKGIFHWGILNASWWSFPY